jgi:hypothetical protein
MNELMLIISTISGMLASIAALATELRERRLERTVSEAQKLDCLCLASADYALSMEVLS